MKIMIGIFFSLLFFLPPKNADEEALKVNVGEELSEIKDTYGEDITYISYYSVEELRPFAILQFESTVSLYDNNWIKPEKYFSMLSSEDKTVLNKKISDYINDFEPIRKLQVIQKLKAYIYTDIQINKLSYSMNISQEDVLITLYNLDHTSSAFDHILKMGKLNVEELNESQKNEAKVSAINTIAELDKNSRLLYYSNFYKQLYDHIN